jgi:hypothetical protein
MYDGAGIPVRSYLYDKEYTDLSNRQRYFLEKWKDYQLTNYPFQSVGAKMNGKWERRCAPSCSFLSNGRKHS